MVTSRRNPVVAATSVDAHQISTQSRQAAAGSSISGSSDGNGWRSSDSELLFTSAPTAPPANATSSTAATHKQPLIRSTACSSNSSTVTAAAAAVADSAATASCCLPAHRQRDRQLPPPPPARRHAAAARLRGTLCTRLKSATSAAPGVYYSRPGSSEFGLIRA